ncbi:MAG: Gfo/Idh/MocA family oxidoreductase, partial [Clostridia bacterium]|nr:Gfo/Idh/MocA family oxidoreductase [Clostridia bacterium]
MKKVRIAQIGLGHDHAPNTLRSLIKQSDIFEFEGLCLPENEMVYADKIEAGEAKIISLEDIFENPEIEAVAVETEEKNLTKYALMAINHGKHIHMDKPGGTEISDFERLINGVKEK